MYESKKKSVHDLVADMPEGLTTWIDVAPAQPMGIIKELGEQRKNISVHTMLDAFDVPWYREDPDIHAVSWFSGAFARKAVNAGTADVMPCHYHDYPALLRLREEINCICLAVSPMDENGNFSLGLTGSASEDIIRRVPYVFLEVNPNMPRCLNGPVVNISRVTALCEGDWEIPHAGKTVIDDVSRKIGDLIAAEVPDGATIQLGIGAIPDAVGEALMSKKHLGIHTELLTDSMIELLECGAVDNSMKPINTGVTVATFAFGSQKMYDYINNNPSVAILPVDYVNDPQTIAQHPNFISINAAIEVDFYGQVCAESIGTKHISGSGGQVDYVRGAVMSRGGKSFISFPSTASGGKVSRIKSILTPGAQVTTGKNEVDMIVTEYGIAKLRGRTLKERTEALIGIAHPDFREELRREAKEMHIL